MELSPDEIYIPGCRDSPTIDIMQVDMDFMQAI
jgi:hypothetical protein